ncbi:MAG: hypothetical protein JST47_13025 [Bacteroidetes bacterium]|nr:hypothetical protein [Bacteroidota bacterium]MBS1975667.1 hypothetical protein [Bacteroidota bacterium]
MIAVWIKKTIGILLLGTLVFNWCGYRVLIFYLEQKANAKLQAQLDKDDYDHSALISIKLPAPNLPYYTSAREFYDMEGEIEMNGLFYKFVKRRLFNDTLEFLCLPNKEAMNLYSAKNEFFKIVNDLQQTGQEKKNMPHTSISKNPSTEYYFTSDVFLCINYFLRRVKYIQQNRKPTSCFIDIPDKPPQFV